MTLPAEVPYKVSATIEVQAWGALLLDAPDYARPGKGLTAHQVFPVGYKVKSSHTVDGVAKNFLCEVRKGEVGPVFSVKLLSDENKTDNAGEGEDHDGSSASLGASATAAFLSALGKISDKKISVNGMGKFALNNEKVIKELKRLEGGGELWTKLDAAAKAKQDERPVTRNSMKKAREEEEEEERANKRQRTEEKGENDTSPSGKKKKEGASTSRAASAAKKGSTSRAASAAVAAADGETPSKRSKRNRELEEEEKTEGAAQEGAAADGEKKKVTRKPRAKKVADTNATTTAGANEGEDVTEVKEVVNVDGAPAKKPRAKKAPVLDENGNPVPPKPRAKKAAPVLDENGNPVEPPPKEKKPRGKKASTDDKTQPTLAGFVKTTKKKVEGGDGVAADGTIDVEAAGTQVTVADGDDDAEAAIPKITLLPALDKASRTKARAQFDNETSKKDDFDGYPAEVKTKQAKRRYLQFLWNFMSEKNRAEYQKRYTAPEKGAPAAAPKKASAATTTTTTTTAGGGVVQEQPSSAVKPKGKKAPSKTPAKKKEGEGEEKEVEASQKGEEEKQKQEEAAPAEGKKAPSPKGKKSASPASAKKASTSRAASKK